MGGGVLIAAVLCGLLMLAQGNWLGALACVVVGVVLAKLG